MPTYILHTHTYTYCTVCVYIWSLAHHHIGPHLGTWTAKHCAIPVQLASRWGPWGTVSKIKHDQSIQQLGCFQKNEYPTVHLKRSWSSQKGWTENSTTSFGGLHGPPNSVWWDTSSHQLPTSFPVCFDGNCVTWSTWLFSPCYFSGKMTTRRYKPTKTEWIMTCFDFPIQKVKRKPRNP